MNDFDHYVKRILKIKYYGRYVDDMIFVHNDKAYLESIIPLLQVELDKVGLTIHLNKTLIVKAEEGVHFLGQMIKPYRKY